MDLDAGAVDEQPVRRVLGAGQGAEDVFPYPALGPAHEAVVERLLRTVDARAIGPPAATTQGVDDPAQHPTIIHPLLAAHVGRQQRLDPSPLRIRKPKEIRHPTPPTSEAVNHAPANSGILLLGPDPGSLLQRFENRDEFGCHQTLPAPAEHQTRHEVAEALEPGVSERKPNAFGDRL
jgi:hypothetical protein